MPLKTGSWERETGNIRNTKKENATLRITKKGCLAGRIRGAYGDEKKKESRFQRGAHRTHRELDSPSRELVKVRQKWKRELHITIDFIADQNEDKGGLHKREACAAGSKKKRGVADAMKRCRTAGDKRRETISTKKNADK